VRSRRDARDVTLGYFFVVHLRSAMPANTCKSATSRLLWQGHPCHFFHRRRLVRAQSPHWPPTRART